MVVRTSLRLFASLFICLLMLLCSILPAASAAVSAAVSAEGIRSKLVEAQLNLTSDPSAVLASVQEAQLTYSAALAPQMSSLSPESHQRVRLAFDQLALAAQIVDPVSFAAARARAWTAILAGAAQIVERSIQNGDANTAREWLMVREFRTATRYSRPGVNATLAGERFARGELPADDAVLAVRADFLDTYQARLGEALRALPEAETNGFRVRRSELAALAEGYFAILAPAYADQRGQAALVAAQSAFASLGAASDLQAALQAADNALEGFRAAPLSPAEQASRAGQLLRFVTLIPVEYGRGVSERRVIHDFEIQEAITFYEASRAAFADLRDLLPPQTVSQADILYDQLGAALLAAAQGASAAEPGEVQRAAEELSALLQSSMPESWLASSSQGDIDVIYSLLDQVEVAVRSGEYAQAESARLEAYAVMETGPEARLLVLAPQLTPEIENLFWNGQGEQKGLAHLLKNRAALKEVQSSRGKLDALLAEAEEVLGHESSPWAVAVNAGVIVFREGMEAVVILASLMSSMRRAEERKYRKPMWWGVLAAFAATLLTWMLARGVMQSLARYGEKLEAVVSLIAVAVLLVIMNWFFHKVYWTSWIAQFHSRKRRLLSGEAGLALGLVILGFTSVYREGFEVVLFLQALVLEAGSGVVLAGTAAGLLLVVLLGLLTFHLQVHLPYRNMLIVTGIMIGVVLLQIVGKMVYAMQVVGWLPIHPIEGVNFAYWWGAWFGIYPTWEGTALQFLAAGFVIGSYYLAEWAQKRRRRAAPGMAL